MLRKIQKIFIICKNFNISIWRYFFLYNVVPAAEHVKLIKSLKFDILIDIGANKGQFSLMCLMLNKKLKIFAFEPVSSVFEILKSVFKMNENVNIFNCALSDKKGIKKININNNVDSSSLLDNRLQDQFFTSSFKISEEKIKIDTLDNFNFIDKNHGDILLKIDVQGYEEFVLKGAKKSLEKIKFILVELSFIELYNNQPLFLDICYLLNDYNFKLSEISDMTYIKGKLIQGDFLFVNNKFGKY